MKILIFGATGATGKEIVSEALAQGHEVTAFVRNPEGLAQYQNRIQIIKGDIFKQTELEAALANQEAVIVALGTKPGSKQLLLTPSSGPLVAAMQAKEVTRLVVLSAFWMERSFNQTVLGRFFVKTPIMKVTYEDKSGQDQIVMASNLDWTIIRASRLVKGQKKGKYRLGEVKPSLLNKINRADGSDAILQEPVNNQFVRKTPVLSY